MLYKIAKVEKIYFLVIVVVQLFFLAPCIHAVHMYYSMVGLDLKLPKMQKKKTI